MDIIIQSLGFTAGKELESFIREKLAKLEVHGGRIIRANVTLYLRPKSAGENNTCEIRLEIAGNDLFVKKYNQQFESAVVEAIDTLDEMVKREKEKHIDRRKDAKGADEIT